MNMDGDYVVFERAHSFDTEITVYVPVDPDDPALGGIVTGAAVLGVPDPADGDSVHLFVEQPGESRISPPPVTLADRALAASAWYCESAVEGRPPWGTVPCAALRPIGVFIPDFESRLMVCPGLERTVAAWLGLDDLPATELEESREKTLMPPPPV
jgi:hypothetical protein